MSDGLRAGLIGVPRMAAWVFFTAVTPSPKQILALSPAPATVEFNSASASKKAPKAQTQDSDGFSGRTTHRIGRKLLDWPRSRKKTSQSSQRLPRSPPRPFE